MNGDGLASDYTPGISHPPPEDVTLPPASSSGGGGGGGGGGGATTITDGTATGAAAVAQATTPLLSTTPCLVIRTVSTQGVTVGDNADTTQGAKADAAATDTTSAWSVIALLKAIFGRLLAVAGNIGGYATFIKDTAAVTIGTYAPGNAVGAKRTLANALRAPLTGVLNSVTLVDRSNSKAAMTLFIFDADPSGATINDKAAFVFGVNDLNVIAQIPIGAGDYITTNSKAVAQLSGLGIVLKGAATTLYAALVTTGAPVFAATTDVQLGLGILQD